MTKLIFSKRNRVTYRKKFHPTPKDERLERKIFIPNITERIEHFLNISLFGDKNLKKELCDMEQKFHSLAKDETFSS